MQNCLVNCLVNYFVITQCNNHWNTWHRPFDHQFHTERYPRRFRLKSNIVTTHRSIKQWIWMDFKNCGEFVWLFVCHCAWIAHISIHQADTVLGSIWWVEYWVHCPVMEFNNQVLFSQWIHTKGNQILLLWHRIRLHWQQSRSKNDRQQYSH